MHCQVFSSENALTLTHITLQNGVKYLKLLSFVPEKELVKMLRCDGLSRDSQPHSPGQFSCSLSQLGAVKEEKSVAAVRAEYNGQRFVGHIINQKPNYTKRSNSMDFGFENIIDFAMDIDKLSLANLVGTEGNGQDHGVQDYFPVCTEK